MNDINYHSVVIYYLGLNPKGEINTDGFDEFEKEYAKEAQWRDVEEAKKLKFYNSINSIALIEKAFKKYEG